MPKELNIQEAERYKSSLLRDRQSWLDEWKDIRDFMLPYHGRFDGENPNEGKRRDDKIVQNAAKMALRVLSAGLLTGLTSPSRPWFRLGLPNPELRDNVTVRAWLDEVERRMYMVFSESNAYPALHAIYQELGGFGTACALVSEDVEDVIRLRVYTIGEYALGLDSRLNVNAVCREIWMTAGQMVEQFGEDKCSDQVRAKVRNQQTEDWYMVNHIIMPNPDKQGNRLDYKGKDFISAYWEKGAKGDGFLQVKGYEEFPILAPRWETISGDSYGRGPSWDTIGDVRMLQDMRLDTLEALDKHVDPPVMMPASLRNENVDLTPGGVTLVPSNDMQYGIRPIYAFNPNFEGLEYSIQQVVERINKAFYVDMFLMLQQVADQQKTAFEVAEMTREKMLMLGPAIEQQEETLLKPLIERTFGIMFRNGLLPEPPQEIQGQPLQIEYVSILAQAQKAVATTAIREWIGMIAEIAQAFPDALMKVNAPEVVDQYGELLGIPVKLIRSDEEVEQAKAQQAQQAQMAQMMAMAQQGAGAAKDLSQTDMGNNTNAIQAMFGEAGV